MISKPRIKFRSKFQFQILYNFTEQLKKLKIVMVMVKSFDMDHHFAASHFGYYLVFSWLRFKHTEYKVTLT